MTLKNLIIAFTIFTLAFSISMYFIGLAFYNQLVIVNEMFEEER